MNESNNKTLKYVVIGLGAAVVLLLLALAFLLGQRSGEKKADPTAPPATEAATLSPVPAEPGTDAPGGETASAAAGEQTTGGSAAPAPQTTAPQQPAVTADAPRNLDISMTAGSLTFVEGTAFGVKYDDKVILVEESGDTVTIENAQRHPSAGERRRMNVTVTVPTGYAFDNVDVEFGAGKLIAHTLRVDALRLELGAGSATLEDLYVTGSAEIQEGAGELLLKSGSIANLTLRCGAGATRVTAALTGTNSIDAAVGAVDLKFDGSESDYTVSFQMGLGACYYNNEKIARNGSFGEGPNLVQINGGFGVMRVNVG